MSDYNLDDAMKAKVLHKLPDLEIESEAVHTWNVENYRNLERKERGPIFECGGHPWYVSLVSTSGISNRRSQSVNSSLGEFYYFHMGITQTMRLYTSNKGMTIKISQRKGGMHVPNSR